MKNESTNADFLLNLSVAVVQCAWLSEVVDLCEFCRIPNFFENIFRTSPLNSFQQLETSIPFSRFIKLELDDISAFGFKQSMKIASFIFLFLHCGSESRKTLPVQLIFVS